MRLAGGQLAVTLVVATVAIAACGHSTSPRRVAARHAGPCVAGARRAVSGAAGATARTAITGVSPGLATCVYDADALRVQALVDTNPQAAVRFDRTVVERAQVAVWSGHHEHAPRLLHGIGQGADWFPADRQLVATDGRKLVSVTVVHSSLTARRALRLAQDVARSTLRGAR